MEMRVVLYRFCSWLRHRFTARHTGGHGVHSPYLFEWVRMVMSDENSYYIWDEIEACRERMLLDDRVVDFVDYGSGARKAIGSGDVALLCREERRKICDIAKKSLSKKKYAQMLARLVNWLGANVGGQLVTERSEEGGLKIVELGTSLGITTAYMAAMDSRNKVMTFEGCSAVALVAKENWKRLGVSNIDCVEGVITAEKLRSLVDRVDVAFVDANHTCVDTCAYFDVLAEKVNEKSVIVVDDIHYDEEMERAWRAICSDKRVTSTMDLYQMGLVFFDKNYWRKHYRLSI